MEMISHLPPSIERLVIGYCMFYWITLYGCGVEWIETSKNPKYLTIECMCVGGRNVDVDEYGGIKLAKILTPAKNTIERLWLDRTDLMGSRNVDE